jgi:hypothetical protein
MNPAPELGKEFAQHRAIWELPSRQRMTQIPAEYTSTIGTEFIFLYPCNTCAYMFLYHISNLKIS